MFAVVFADSIISSSNESYLSEGKDNPDRFGILEKLTLYGKLKELRFELSLNRKTDDDRDVIIGYIDTILNYFDSFKLEELQDMVANIINKIKKK